MKLSTGFLLPAFIGAASAISDASVYTFQGEERPNTSNPPTLSLTEARLIFAQRLGVSQYHGIGSASELTLSHINIFGGRRASLFQDELQDKAAELLILVNGVSSEDTQDLLREWSSIKPAFKIGNAPSLRANLQLVQDLQRQVGSLNRDCPFEEAINPFSDRCWNGKSKTIYMDLSAGNGPGMGNLIAAKDKFMTFGKSGEMNVMVVLMPLSSSGPAKNPYGLYEMPSQARPGRRQAEEPMTELPATSSMAKSKQVLASNSSTPFEPITGVPPVCYSSLDSCMSRTNNCSSHGECYKKYGSAEGQDASPACYACGCVPTKEDFLEGESQRPAFRITYWGGAACQKKDVSGPFWLFAIFSVVMIGLVSWSIGLLFSIGEEKLPGVIGAGVSSKAR